MAVLITLLEQHLIRQPPTVVTQATTWWETVVTLVELQEIGLRVHLPVKVCYYRVISFLSYVHIQYETQQYVFWTFNRYESIVKGITMQAGPRLG